MIEKVEHIIKRMKDRCPNPDNRCCGICMILEKALEQSKKEEERKNRR